jgi:sulfite reductase (NADPH) flavoprotein alpha-component
MASGTYSRKNPFNASVTDVHCLNGVGSGKEVNHIALSLEGSDLTYDAGDALGVLPLNDPELVDEILAALGCDGEEAVSSPDGIEVPLRRALTEFYDLGPINKKLETLLNLVEAGGLAAKPEAPAPAAPLHVIDALVGCENKPGAVDFVATLRKLQPRLYSIASSIKAHPGEVHLTVAAVRYETLGRKRLGVCSTYLSDRIRPGESQVAVFVHNNKAFKLPEDGGTPIIMVGPGTGIAPFRSFLEERKAVGATGKNWLFFGDQHEATDFLYKDELLAMMSDGHLSRLDLAWSRDQEKKIYVQDRMLEAANDIFAWLEDGAHFYVCGDAKRMAKDVDAALHRIIETVGGKSPEEAAVYVKDLKAHKRYARDVY